MEELGRAAALGQEGLLLAIDSLAKALAIYNRVHEEMDGGDDGPMKPYEEIDNGLINGGEKYSYRQWQAYMTQTIINRAESVVLSSPLAAALLQANEASGSPNPTIRG